MPKNVLWNVISEKVKWSNGRFEWPLVIEWQEADGFSGFTIYADGRWEGSGYWENAGGTIDKLGYTALGRLMDHLNTR